LDLCIELNSTVLQRHTPHPHSLRPLDCTTEVKVFQRKIQIGADGSLIHNGDEVFFIEIGVVASIDYFYGCVGALLDEQSWKSYLSVLLW
jgi:hypothetical protein